MCQHPTERFCELLIDICPRRTGILFLQEKNQKNFSASRRGGLYPSVSAKFPRDCALRIANCALKKHPFGCFLHYLNHPAIHWKNALIALIILWKRVSDSSTSGTGTSIESAPMSIYPSTTTVIVFAGSRGTFSPFT